MFPAAAAAAVDNDGDGGDGSCTVAAPVARARVTRV